MSKLETTSLESGRESCQERLPQVRYPRAAVLWYSSSSVLWGDTEDSGKYWGDTALRSIRGRVHPLPYHPSLYCSHRQHHHMAKLDWNHCSFLSEQIQNTNSENLLSFKQIANGDICTKNKCNQPILHREWYIFYLNKCTNIIFFMPLVLFIVYSIGTWM